MRGSSTQPACYCPQQRQAGSFFRIGGENRAEGETIPIGQRMIFAGLLVIEEQPRLSAFRARAEEMGRAHVCTRLHNAHLVCPLLCEKKNKRYTIYSHLKTNNNKNDIQ